MVTTDDSAIWTLNALSYLGPIVRHNCFLYFIYVQMSVFVSSVFAAQAGVEFISSYSGRGPAGHEHT